MEYRYTTKQKEVEIWFQSLRDRICQSYEIVEDKFAQSKGGKGGKFAQKKWYRKDGGGGEISIMHGQVFEKVGVNVSTVHGEFTEKFRIKIPGADQDPRFFATGISIVAHMHSPLLPAMHFNTRFIQTKKCWFGGGADLTPIYPDDNETHMFHMALKTACDKYNAEYYLKFKKECDEYFYLKHRNEPRGVGGIFFDYLNNNDNKSEIIEDDFSFVKDVGLATHSVYPKIVSSKMFLPWNEDQRQHQLIRRGRYVEFNLLYDRGTMFGLETGGNVEAILMSMPPNVAWP